MAYDDIPDEIRRYNQWICWRYEVTPEGKPTKIPLRPTDGKRANVTNPLDWTNFATAVARAHNCDGIGFVFTKSDPFCGIDLDGDNQGTTANFQQQVCEFFGSYAEHSPSGYGVHIIAKATLPGKGRRKNGVEIYDNARYFTFTGNRINAACIIRECQVDVVSFWASLAPPSSLIELPATAAEQFYTDAQVLERAAVAANCEKFKRLWDGDWKSDYGERSQSEADFALINIISFYSRNVEQTTRLFRASGLGQREKARRGNYVGLMVKRSFDRLPLTVSPVNPAGIWFNARQWTPYYPKNLPLAVAAPPYQPPPAIEPTVILPPLPKGLPPIPGLVGKLMQHCWHQSPRQIPEVSVASALASMSLLCSRTYRYGSRGLALYILILAKTSVGKGFAYQAQNAWQNALIRRYSDPTAGSHYKARAEFAQNMFCSKLASGPGLAQQMLRAPTTLAQLDEFADDIKRMSSGYVNPNMESIKNELLSLVDAAKPGAIYREKPYSNRGPNKVPPVSVHSACLTICATGTPERFYDDLNVTLLEGGFLPRFTLLEFMGTIPDKNENEIHEIDRELLDEINMHFNKNFELQQVINGNMNQIQNVAADDVALKMLKEWDNYCVRQVRNAHGEGLPTAGVWSRAEMHVTQIAALIAIGVNPHNPIINKEYVEFALQIVLPGLERLTGNVKLGATGTGDLRCEAHIRECVRRIQKEGYYFLHNPNISEAVRHTDYIQLSAIAAYCKKFAAFNTHKFGANRAFTDTINSMVANGELEKREFAIINGRKVQVVKPISQ